MLQRALEKENIPSVTIGEQSSTRVDGMLYRSTNEDLTRILSPIDFKDKRVLSVTASSDQPFSCMYLGATDLEIFDSNINAYYYYFLRKWNMLHTHKYYLSANNNELVESLAYSDGTPEEDFAAYMWNNLLVRQKQSLYYSKLFYRTNPDYSVPFENDVETMIKLLKERTPRFHNINLFRGNEEFENNNKYDIIILSNILEYLYEYEDLNLEREVAKRLYNLLNEGGILVASNILDYENSNRLINEYFEYIEGEYGKAPRFNKEIPLSYTLRKK